MKRILIHNQKGGVGKTTTAANLAAALARGGAGQVVLADLDPQMHLTALLGQQAAPRPGWTAADWVAGRPGAPLPVPDEPGLSLIPGAPDLALSDRMPPVAADWLVIDTSPHWQDALAGLARDADLVLCPLEPDFLGLSGANRLLQTLGQTGIGLDRIRFVLCRYDTRLALHREVRARLQARFGETTLLPVVIRSSVRLAEAPGQGRTIFAHAPTSSGATDYARLAAVLSGDDAAQRRVKA